MDQCRTAARIEADRRLGTDRQVPARAAISPREIKAENELALAYAGYGRLHRQRGDVGQAREYLTRALEIFEGLRTLAEPDRVRQELAELPAA